MERDLSSNQFPINRVTSLVMYSLFRWMYQMNTVQLFLGLSKKLSNSYFIPQMKHFLFQNIQKTGEIFYMTWELKVTVILVCHSILHQYFFGASSFDITMNEHGSLHLHFSNLFWVKYIYANFMPRKWEQLTYFV